MWQTYRSLLKTIASSIILLTLASCGFHPVYKSSNEHKIPDIQINSINSVDGAELYGHLSDLIHNTPGARYVLDIKLTPSSSPLAITKSSDVIQQSAVQLVAYTLLDQTTGKTIAGSFAVMGSYNTTYSAYATHVEERRESMNLARQSAEEMYRRLMIYFINHRD